MKHVSKRFLLIGIMVFVLAIPIIGVHAADVANCTQYHTIVRGNTLSSIARLYNSSVANLQTINRIPNINIIYVGQKLCVNVGNAQPVPNQPGQVTGKVINAYWLNVRSGPGVQFTILRTVRRNDVLLIQGRSVDGKWLILSNPTHTMEWVSAAYIEIGNIMGLPVFENTTSAAIPATAIANTPIYYGPGFEYTRTGSDLYINQTITILGKNINTTWYKIQTAQAIGWVPVTAFPESVKLYLFPVIS